MNKLFVSLPMADREIDDIRADMQAICEIVSTEMDEEFELIDTICTDEPTDISDEPGAWNIWYLGKSINALSQADLVVFDSDWQFARGCIIEHMVCAMYNIPYVDMAMSYSNDDAPINDYTVDRNEAARINSVLSEAYEEDALGFEHDDISDLEGEPEEIDDIEDDIDALEPGEYDADA